VRDALLSESVPPQAHGRAFGFQGAMDTVGAIIGPAIALSLVGVLPLPRIFLIAFIPGAITVYIALFVLREVPRAAQPKLRLWASYRELPRDFWLYVGAVGVFGLGNFAHTLLVLHAVRLLAPYYTQLYGDPEAAEKLANQVGIGLFIIHNVLYAAASYPAGALGDRIDKKLLLAFGYALFGVMCLGFLFTGPDLAALVVLFGMAGVYIAVVDAMQRAIAADLLPLERRATGYGALATVNSFGDLGSSIAVGLLWTYASPAAGFAYGAVLTLLGALALVFVPKRPPPAGAAG
jgi:MFS family permease